MIMKNIYWLQKGNYVCAFGFQSYIQYPVSYLVVQYNHHPYTYTLDVNWYALLTLILIALYIGPY